MSNTIYHNHHIVPRHMGGADDSSNLVRLTVEEHAEAHRKLYEEHNKLEDKLAWKMLEGQSMMGETLLMKCRLGGLKSGIGDRMRGVPKSDDWKRKVSQSKLGVRRPYMLDGDHPRSTTVWIEGKIFTSIKEAYIYHDTNKTTVRNRCNNDNFPEWSYMVTREGVIMFEDEDIDKANWLHEHGMCVEFNMTDLAKRLYEQRQHDKSEDVKPLVSGDRE